MITDRNEAFKHNSCKKLAQLTRVVTSMLNSAKDRYDEIDALTNDYDRITKQTIEEYKEGREIINSGLFKYRKSCIDQSCKDFGQFYKDLKHSYNLLSQSFTNKINEISKEGKDINGSISVVNDTIIVEITNKSQRIDTIRANIINSFEKSEKYINQSSFSQIQDISQNCQQLVKESEERYGSLQRVKKNELQKLNEEMSKLYSNEVLKRRSDFKNMKERLSNIRKYIGSIKIEYSMTDRQQSELFQTYYKRRAAIISDMKHSLKVAKNQAVSLSEKQKLLEKQSKDAKKDLLIEFEQIRQQRSQHLGSIDRIISEIKYKCNHIDEEKASDVAAQNAAISSVTNELNYYFENESKNISDSMKASISFFEQSFIQLQYIRDFVYNSLVDNYNNLEIFHKTFSAKQKQQLTYHENRLKETKLHFNRRIAEKQSMISGTIAAQSEINSSKISGMKSTNNSTRDSIYTMKQKNSSTKSEKLAKNQEQVESYIKNCNQRQANRSSELENSKAIKNNENMKRRNEINNKFSLDITSVQDNVRAKSEKENQKSIIEIIEKSSINKEKDAYNNQQSELNSIIENISKDIKNSRNESQKIISNYQTQLTTLEKSKRQFIRSTKTETEKIISDFEMKIQVEQVGLHDKIDRISALYDNEENKRGREIIESIRKVRDIKNRGDDLIQKKKKSFNDNQKQLKGVFDSLIEQKTKLNHNEVFEKLSYDLENKRSKSLKMVNDYLTETSLLSNDLRQLIIQENQNQIVLKKVHFDEQECNNSQFNKQQIEHNKLITNLKSEEKAKRELIEVEYEKKKSEMITNHTKSLSFVRQKLESAKQQLKENTQKLESEYNTKVLSCEDYYNGKQSQNDQIIIKSQNTGSTKIDQLDSEIFRLVMKQSDIEFSFLNPSIRRVDISKINDFKSQIHEKSVSIQSCFDSICSFLENMPEIAHGRPTSKQIKKQMSQTEVKFISLKVLPNLQ